MGKIIESLIGEHIADRDKYPENFWNNILWRAFHQCKGREAFREFMKEYRQECDLFSSPYTSSSHIAYIHAKSLFLRHQTLLNIDSEQRKVIQTALRINNTY